MRLFSKGKEDLIFLIEKSKITTSLNIDASFELNGLMLCYGVFCLLLNLFRSIYRLCWYLRWCHAQNFDKSKIPVIAKGFEDSSRRFLSFETSKL